MHATRTKDEVHPLLTVTLRIDLGSGLTRPMPHVGPLNTAAVVDELYAVRDDDSDLDDPYDWGPGPILTGLTWVEVLDSPWVECYVEDCGHRAHLCSDGEWLCWLHDEDPS